MKPLLLGAVLATIVIFGGAVAGLRIGILELPGSATTPSGPATTRAPARATAVPGPLKSGTWQVIGPSWVGYSIGETTFLGTGTVTGRTTTVSGSGILAGTSGGFSLSGSTFSADLRSLSSGDPFGDQQVQAALGTSQFPTATFDQAGSIALPPASALAAGVTVAIPGRVTLRGQSHAVTVPATVSFTGGHLVVIGSIPFRLSSFGITPGAFGGLVTLSDAASLNLSIVLARG